MANLLIKSSWFFHIKFSRISFTINNYHLPISTIFFIRKTGLMEFLTSFQFLKTALYWIAVVNYFFLHSFKKNLFRYFFHYIFIRYFSFYTRLFTNIVQKCLCKQNIVMELKQFYEPADPIKTKRVVLH